MAYNSSNIKIGTLVANASFATTGQFRFGTINSSGKIALTGSGGRADGVIANNPAADVAVEFTIFGIEMVEYGGTITAGDNVKSGASGVAVTHGGTGFVVGVALASGVSGDIHPVLIKQTGTES